LIALRKFHAGLDPDKEAFHRYLGDFHAVASEAELLDSLLDCADPLPHECAVQLGLPVGSAYRDAVKLLLCSWSNNVRAPGERSFD
jgi:hypothetical protein